MKISMNFTKKKVCIVQENNWEEDEKYATKIVKETESMWLLGESPNKYIRKNDDKTKTKRKISTGFFFHEISASSVRKQSVLDIGNSRRCLSASHERASNSNAPNTGHVE